MANKKTFTIHDYEIYHVEGTGYQGVGDFIFHGTTKEGRKIEMWISAERLMKIAEMHDKAHRGVPGHTMWHLNDGTPAPCEMCREVNHDTAPA